MRRAVHWAAGFFLAHRPQSMTRLIAFCCGLSGCVVAIHSPEAWQTVTALVGGGAVSLLVRTKPNGTDGSKSDGNSP